MAMKILLVDDSEADMMLLRSILEEYELSFAYNGCEAMEILNNSKDIDLMILDLNMPIMDGFEVLKAISSENLNYDITTIILTNNDELDNEVKGLNLGAVDYIRKPLNFQSLSKRVEIHSRLRKAGKLLEQHNAILEETVLQRTMELAITRDITIQALVKLLEVRNIESSNHAVRTQNLMRKLCEHLSGKKQYQGIFTTDYIKELCDTAPLHDIGKVGIPDSILLKPGKLTYDEFEIMKRHTTYGVEALRYNCHTEGSFSFLKTASEIIENHHERYDGKGYPNGLIGEKIALPGRLMSIIDVYDALISERVYKPAFSHNKAIEIMLEGRGTQFDGDLLDGFLEMSGNINNI